jgi:CRP/FNR family transcriptional regulator, cyclic AMP receptor protein
MTGGARILEGCRSSVRFFAEGLDLEREADRHLVDDGRRLLGECILFRGFAAAERHALFSRIRIRTFPAGATIFLMGEPGDTMMAVLSGKVRISVPSQEGRELLLAILSPGDVFGEIALLDGKQRTADATAVTKCSLAVLERREILSFFERHPAAWANIVDVLCNRLRRTDEHLAEVAFLQLPARLAKALLRGVSAEGHPVIGQQSNQIQLSQRELGNLVGAARESVNKCLRGWQDEGIIAIKGSVITIKNRAALEDLAQCE